MTPSRRSFLKSSAVTVAAASLARPRSLFADAESKPLAEFKYGDVELLEGPLRHQFDTNHAVYATLDEDSLLQPFRQRAGLPAPGPEMGGWYSWAPLEDIDKRPNNGFAPGHSFGQYLSGLSRDYAATGNKATQAKVHRLVRNFAPAISPHFWDDNRFPAYTYDKISIGLLDAHQFAGAPHALKVLDQALDSVQAHLPPGGISREEQYKTKYARPHNDDSFCWDEPYTLGENAFIAYQRGAGQRYRDLAIHFLPNSWYYDPLAAGENVLPGKHAYSHVNCMSSAAQAYLVLGDEKYLRAARNGFDFLTKTQSFATGGWGPDENFRTPGSGEVGQSLTKTHSSFETPCGSYAHFKITRYLTRITRDSRYGDSMERVLYNCILGALPRAHDGHGFYYSDYSNDGSKFYHPYKWHCCTGTFSQVTADYGISSYFHDPDSIYVNLYVPSRVKWSRMGDRVVLTQRTSYPDQPSTQIEVTTLKTSAFRVFLRIPALVRSQDHDRRERPARCLRPRTGQVPGARPHLGQRRPHRGGIRHAHHPRPRRPRAPKSRGPRARPARLVQRWRCPNSIAQAGPHGHDAGRLRLIRLASQDQLRRFDPEAFLRHPERALPPLPQSRIVSTYLPFLKPV